MTNEQELVAMGVVGHDGGKCGTKEDLEMICEYDLEFKSNGRYASYIKAKSIKYSYNGNYVSKVTPIDTPDNSVYWPHVEESELRAVMNFIQTIRGN
tara:strand:- start:73652 stop:73942 length:291 start_codon:yes stop_codon:yes gene_type:complete